MSSRLSVRRRAALLLFVAHVACSSEQAQPGPSTTSSLASTTTTTASPVASATTTPTPAPTIPGGCPSGTGVAAQNAPQAARCLYEAWKQDDQVGAAVYASLDVVEILFQKRWSAPEGTYEGCSAQPAGGGQTCAYEHHGERYEIEVRPSEGGWRVTQVEVPS